MNEREEAGRRLYEACLSGNVQALEALIEKDQLILNRLNSLECFFNDTPLHVAVSCGHLDFTKALLSRKPKLATELDSLQCSPLHLASAEGHVEIVRELLRVNTDVCIARDQDGRIPLHLAAIKGRVEVIQELLRVKPESIHEIQDRGKTVLHLCVKYNRLEALKMLVEYLQSNQMESLLSAGDDDDNTFLHLAAALKQMNTIEYLLGIKSVKDKVNVRNRYGSTVLNIVEHCPNRDLKTMEIREFLLQAGVRRSVCIGSDPMPESPPNTPPNPQTDPYPESPPDNLPNPPTDPNPESPPENPPPQRRCKARVIMKRISTFWKKYLKADHAWLPKVRGHLITAATVTATMAYQAILSPPGGFWQSTTEEGDAGTAILDTYMDNLFAAYLAINTVVLVASLCTIMLALSGFPADNKFFIWLMIFTSYTTILCLAGAYFVSIILVFPFVWHFSNLPVGVMNGLIFLMIGTCGFLVAIHTFHFWVWLRRKTKKFIWLRNKFGNLVKTCRTSRGPRGTDKITTEVNPTGSYKLLEKIGSKVQFQRTVTLKTNTIQDLTDYIKRK